MAKVSPVSIKYMIHVNFSAEGALEKPDVIGAIFGQTEGLLGNDLEMRELQKEGKIGRIEVDLERDGKRTIGKIQIPTALDQSETTLIGAAVETIERIGPCDSQLEVDRIEDVRGTKRDYIIDRAKALMKRIEGTSDSREISNAIKDSARHIEVAEYGAEKLPSGDLSGQEIYVVEGRADVVNLLRHGVVNVIGMNGTKLPDTIKTLGEDKKLTLFVDGDRGGRLIASNVCDNARIDAIICAPDGKEVEELQKKEILMAFRRKYSPEEFFAKFESNGRGRHNGNHRYERRDREEASYDKKDARPLRDEEKTQLKDLGKSNEDSGRAIIYSEGFEEIKSVSAKAVARELKRLRAQPFAIVIDGTATPAIVSAAEEAGCSAIAAKNFTTAESSLTLVSL